MRRSLFLLAALAGSAGLFACSGLLGLQEPTVDDTIGGDGSTSQTDGGDAGDSGSTGDATPDTGDDATASDGGDGGGGPVVLASGIRPWDIIVDDTYVYWTESLTSRVMRASKVDGSGAIPMADGNNSAGYGPRSITQDGTYLYWNSVDTIFRCDKAGCQNAPTALCGYGTGTPNYVAVDGNYVYFTEYGPGDLYRIDKTASSGTPQHLADFSDDAEGLVVTGGNVYVALDTGEVVRVPVGGGTPVTVTAPGAPAPAYGLTLAGSKLYWTNLADPGKVSYVETSGFDAGTSPVALQEHYPFGITSDTTDLYWVASGNFQLSDGIVRKCSLAQCTPTDFATKQNVPKFVAVDSAFVYWTDYGNSSNLNDGFVMKAPK